MNDETVPATALETPAFAAPAPRPVSVWLKRLLVCNPFFLGSALLLLYGLYRVSIDPKFLATEVAQLTFNFTSLQLYELLLVITAAILARRFIWYDASLLVVLENLFILVPFILISQAALIDQPAVSRLCAAALLMAVVRAEGLRRNSTPLWHAPKFFSLGALVLLVNSALPVIYRHLHEDKFGTKLETGPAFEFNRFAWLYILPLLVALANFLPKPPTDRHPLRQRRWFSHALFSFWLTGTAVHLYCLGYVYDFDLSRQLVVPALWVLAWTLFRKLPDFASAPALRAGAMALPLPMALAAADTTGSHVFAVLTLANVVGFAWIALRERDNRFALSLCLISLAAVVAGAPADWLMPKFAGFDRAKLIALAAAAYCVLCCILSRNPKAGLFGAVATACGVGYLLESTSGGGWWAVQSGFAFFLLHGLRWRDYEHPGAAGARIFMACAWVIHSFFWARHGVGALDSLILPALILTACAAARLVSGCWVSLVLPIAALVSAMCAPLDFAAAKVQSAPTGLLAITGSFLLLGIGALAALTKHRWHPPQEHHEP